MYLLSAQKVFHRFKQMLSHLSMVLVNIVIIIIIITLKIIMINIVIETDIKKMIIIVITTIIIICIVIKVIISDDCSHVPALREPSLRLLLPLKLKPVTRIHEDETDYH